MRVVRRIAAFLLGFVFFIAGILKLMDPVGAALVMEEYFKFLLVPFLSFMSGVAAVGMALLETIVGAALITGVWKKNIGILSGAMMAFFTLLTLAMLIFNPDMDCGCFGEAVKLTHAQTFVKNLILCALWAISFIPLSKQEQVRKVKYVSFGIAAASVIAFTVFSLRTIPMVDFTPMAPGEDVRETLSFSDAGGEYRDELALEGNVMLVSEYNPDEVSDRKSAKLDEFASDASSLGFTILFLKSEFPLESDGFYFADRRALMTLNRSNGGATFVSDGQIVRKWAAGSLPDAAEMQELLEVSPTEAMMNASSSSRLKVQGFLLYVFAVMLLL